jgi:fructose-1,6-bisphosphatase I
LISGLKRTRLVRYIATEEQPGIIEIENPKNHFGIVIDPHHADAYGWKRGA